MRLEEVGDVAGFIIQGYGDGAFRISGRPRRGSQLILREQVLDWRVNEPAEITLDSLAPLVAEAAAVEVLLIGTGARMERVPEALCQVFRDKHGISVDYMDTGAACRTFNVLQVDGRAVAAALIAP